METLQAQIEDLQNVLLQRKAAPTEVNRESIKLPSYVRERQALLIVFFSSRGTVFTREL